MGKFDYTSGASERTKDSKGNNVVHIYRLKDKGKHCYHCREGIQLGETVVTVPNGAPHYERVYFHRECFNQKEDSRIR